MARMDNDDPFQKNTFPHAILTCYAECMRSQGRKVEMQVGPHKVVAYGVGTNLLRIDIKFAVERTWPVEHIRELEQLDPEGPF